MTDWTGEDAQVPPPILHFSKVGHCCIFLSLNFDPQQKRAAESGPFSHSSLLRTYSGKPGSASVCSMRTAFSDSGSRPKAFRIVTPTWEVATGVLITCPRSPGFETIRPTFVSPKLKPPCSAFFLLEVV